MKKQPNIELLRKGDQLEWEKFVEELSPKLFSLFRSRLGMEDQEVRDLVSEVFMKAYSAISSFRGDSSPTTWVYSIASNLAYDYIKRHQKDRDMIHYTDEIDYAVEDNWQDVELRRQASILWSLIDKIPVSNQKALLLYYLSGKSYREVADVLGVPIGTVKTLLYRAKKSLRELYEREKRTDRI